MSSFGRELVYYNITVTPSKASHTSDTHKLSPVPVVPVSSKPVSYKQLIQTVKQSRPHRVSKPIVQVQ